MPFYFAYAEDLDPETLSARCGGRQLEPVCLARMRHYTVNFRASRFTGATGVATLDPSPDDSVTGALYDLTQPELSLLGATFVDPRAGLVRQPGSGSAVCDLRGRSSLLTSQGLLGDGDAVDATVYRALDATAPLTTPSEGALRAIAIGALRCDLPYPYVASLVGERLSVAGPTVADHKLNAFDISGKKIKIIYSKVPPRYAVYGTEDGVRVAYADNPDLAQAQRIAMAALNPLRSEINSLLDGWQRDDKKRDVVQRFNGPVSSALIMSLEGDSAGALIGLTRVRDDILGARLSIGRLYYLGAALAATVVFVAGLMLLRRNGTGWLPFSANIGPLELAAKVGAIGAFFSIAIGLRDRSVRTDLHKIENIMDAALRVAIGSIAAVVLTAMLQTDLVGKTLKALLMPGGSKPNWLTILVIAFIAGFLERLVPNMLNRAGVPETSGPSRANTEAAAPGPRR